MQKLFNGKFPNVIMVFSAVLLHMEQNFEISKNNLEH